MHATQWLILPLLLASFTGNAQTAGFTRNKAITLKRVVERNHIQPVAVNDEFSKRLFNGFLEEYDEAKLLLQQEDVDALRKYETLLDDELNGTAPWQFLDAATAVLKNRLRMLPALMEQSAARPFAYTQPATFNHKATAYAAGAAALEQRWAAYLKWQVLNLLLDDAEDGEAEKKPVTPASLMTHEPAYRKTQKDLMVKHLQSLLNAKPSFEQNLADDYFQALTACFDPHTAYLSLTEKKRFQDMLSDRKATFGFSFGEEGNNLVIEKLAPGSPAWNSNQLHKGDIIISLQWNNEPTVITSGMDTDALDEFMDYEADQLTMTVKKSDGTEKKVVLRRQKMVVEEDVVKSYLLTGSRKIGYISLPDFYTTWNEEGARGCGTDVALELAKLKKENIEGLILDLRYNGGGSLMEALELSGLFIDDGPLSMVKSNDGKLRTLRDMNRGIMYEGPLVVLVNNGSASASELVAATLQDLNRAVIVGAPTFGKATAQVILPVDTVNKYGPGDTREPEMGFVKVTTGRIFRLTGTTAQQAGVQPHVLLPAIPAMQKEAALPWSLAPETIAANSYYKPLPALPAARLQQNSNARTATSFSAVSKKIPAVAAWMNTTAWSLVWNTALQDRKKMTMAFEEEENVTPDATMHVSMHQFNRQRWHATEALKEISDDWMKKTGNDIYIIESYHIINDLIQIYSNK